MDQITSLNKFRVPIGNQEIELQQVAFEAGGTPLLRLRIRERSRFTIFDIDPVTAAHWGKLMSQWAQDQLAALPDEEALGESQSGRHGAPASSGDTS